MTARLERFAESAALSILAKFVRIDPADRRPLTVASTADGVRVRIVVEVDADGEALDADMADTVNDRMKAKLEQDHEAASWSLQKWADFLGCSKSTAHDTAMWAAIMAQRENSRLRRGEGNGTQDADDE